MAPPYKLAFTLHGHSADVRNLAIPNAEVPLLLSASRDGSAIVWGPSPGSKEWDAKLRVEELERKYVSCVTMVNYQGQGGCSFVITTFELTVSIPAHRIGVRHVVVLPPSLTRL
jgi:phospholipase A-2-activating protein